MEAYQGVEQELPDPFMISSYAERNEFEDDFSALEQQPSSATFPQVMESREELPTVVDPNALLPSSSPLLPQSNEPVLNST